MYFFGFLAFVVAQRLTELIISKRNEKWLREQGAIEYGRGHYAFIVLLHTMFFVSMLVEYFSSGEKLFEPIFFLMFLLLIILKIWIISSLGRYWNTRILRVPNFVAITKGPYKIILHPNYCVVIAEIAIIPLVFHLYYTAIIFSLLNAEMLFVRIREENKAWGFSKT